MNVESTSLSYSILVEKFKRYFSQKRDIQFETLPSKSEGVGRIRINRITGDRKACSRMASMGLYSGVEAEIVCSGKGNNCILKLDGGTIILDADVSKNIIVSSL